MRKRRERGCVVRRLERMFGTGCCSGGCNRSNAWSAYGEDNWDDPLSGRSDGAGRGEIGVAKAWGEVTIIRYHRKPML